MNTKLIFCLCLVAFTMAAEITEEEGVIVLTEANFDEVISQNKNVLVEFYAPWCGHCKQLAPEYAKAAVVLKAANPPVILGKVDTTVEKKLGERFQVQGYPTLKFFIDQQPIEFNGGRTEPEIISWCNKKVGPSTRLVEDQADLEAAIAANRVVVVYFGSEEQFSVYEQVSRSVDDVVFLRVNND
jgi:protein disulfide-isomerase A1